MLEKNLNRTDFEKDQSLLRQIGQGNKSSFNELYEKYWEMVYTKAYTRLKDSDQAKDIVQEIFTHIWIKRETCQINNLPAYLNIAVRNKVFKLVAKQNHSHSFFSILENMSEVHYHPDANVLTKEFFKSLELLVNALPPKKQMIFRLRFEEDLSTKDIAGHLRLSRKTIQNQLGKMIEQLRVSLLYLLIILLSLLAD